VTPAQDPGWLLPGVDPDANNGGAPDVVASSPPNFLQPPYSTVALGPTTSYTLVFDIPLDSFSFTRAGYCTSLAYPPWTATAKDNSGNVLGILSEGSGSTWVSCSNPSPGPQVFTFSTPGIKSVTIDSSLGGRTGPPLDDLILAVGSSSTSTSAGSDVVVQPPAVDAYGDPIGESPVTFTFQEVIGAGETTITVRETGPPPPTGFKLGAPPTYFDLTTTAEFTGFVEVCIDYSGIDFGNESKLKLQHFGDSGSNDITTSLDTVADVICGQTTSLSVFAIFEPLGPVADAGPDQSVNEGDGVTLDGSGSGDPQGDPLIYNWVQVAGPGVLLDLNNPVFPTFTAPFVAVGGATLTFELVVRDEDDVSEPDVVNITVVNVNNKPVADAGKNQDGSPNNLPTVPEAAFVTLNGSHSYDPDVEPLTYAWTQLLGQSVTLSDPTSGTPTFTAPLSVAVAGETLTFQLVVNDGIEDSDPDTVDVLVTHVNQPPTAVIAGSPGPLTKDELTTVTLDGSGSSDPEEDSLTFLWEQTGGSTVTMIDPGTAVASFEAPAVGAGGEDLTFQLTVGDGEFTDTDSIVIHVQQANDPPNCGDALASSARLWPPNHKMKLIEIQNVTDPQNDTVTITVTGITQDEPANGLGDGDSSPDAVIQAGNQNDTVLLRAERSGNENGRVYQVSFMADDGFLSCDGFITVTVPHSRKGAPAVDDGQNFDSTQP